MDASLKGYYSERRLGGQHQGVAQGLATRLLPFAHGRADLFRQSIERQSIEKGGLRAALYFLPPPRLFLRHVNPHPVELFELIQIRPGPCRHDRLLFIDIVPQIPDP
jgi:hypothetical protein